MIDLTKGDVDMDDVWKMLDSDKSGDLTFDEFTCTLMGRPPVIQEAFMVHSEEGEMPAADLGLVCN